MNDFIETRIISAVRELLTGQVNELLGVIECPIPLIDFTDYGGGSSVTPVINLVTCERTEKERIVRLDSYSLTISFTLPESPDSELHCYAYPGAVGRAVYENPTLGGVVNRAVISAKKYISPKKPHCGEPWELVLALRITVEGMTE